MITWRQSWAARGPWEGCRALFVPLPPSLRLLPQDLHRRGTERLFRNIPPLLPVNYKLQFLFKSSTLHWSLPSHAHENVLEHDPFMSKEKKKKKVSMIILVEGCCLKFFCTGEDGVVPLCALSLAFWLAAMNPRLVAGVNSLQNNWNSFKTLQEAGLTLRWLLLAQISELLRCLSWSFYSVPVFSILFGTCL